MPPPPKTPNSSMWIWIVVALFVFSLIGVGIWYFLIRKEHDAPAPITGFPPPAPRAPAPITGFPPPAPRAPAPITGFPPPAPQTSGPATSPQTFILTAKFGRVANIPRHYIFDGSDRMGIMSPVIGNPNLTFFVGDTILINSEDSEHKLHIRSSIVSPAFGTETIPPSSPSQTSVLQVTWTPQAPGVFYYTCENYASMNGKIFVIDLSVPTVPYPTSLENLSYSDSTFSMVFRDNKIYLYNSYLRSSCKDGVSYTYNHPSLSFDCPGDRQKSFTVSDDRRTITDNEFVYRINYHINAEFAIPLLMPA